MGKPSLPTIRQKRRTLHRQRNRRAPTISSVTIYFGNAAALSDSSVRKSELDRRRGRPPLLTMEYVDGEDLASLLRRIGRIPEDKAIQMARQLCAAVSAAHEGGVLHRDLKPANVMIDGDGNVLVTDFGIATTADAGAEMAGTPQYRAPELLAGRCRWRY